MFVITGTHYHSIMCTHVHHDNIIDKKCIFVRTVTGETLRMYIEASSDLKVIKKAIQARLGVSCHVQQLYFGRKLLLDHQNVGMLPDEAHINLKYQLLGGPSNFCDICNDPGVYTCPQCNNQIICRECCNRLHKHPNRCSHTPQSINVQEVSHNNEPLCGSHPLAKSPADSSPTDFSDDDFPSSPGLDAVLTQATHVATLAQQFNLTAFNDFQQVIIDAVLTKRDTLVIQPSVESHCATSSHQFMSKRKV